LTFVPFFFLSNNNNNNNTTTETMAELMFGLGQTKKKK